MRIILFLFFLLIISSCSKDDECDIVCNQWEPCTESYDSFSFTTSWFCSPIINQYWGEYLGSESMTFNNGTSITNDNKAIYLDLKRTTLGDPINSRRLKIDIINYNDSLQYNYSCTNNDLIIYFIDPSSTNFNIPKQSTFSPIYSPQLSSIIYTNVSYEGNGNIKNGIISISCTFEFLYNNGSYNNGSYNYVGPNNWF